MICEICNSDDWKLLKGGWARCNICGRLETVSETKQCQKCKRNLGKYSKANQKLCLSCIKARGNEERHIPCKIKGCCNTLGESPSPSMMCKQCIKENDKQKGLHLWKTKAIKILKHETKKSDLEAMIKEEYDLIGQNSIVNWLHKSKKVGTIKSTGFGAYISTGHQPKAPTLPPSDFIELTTIKH